MYELGYALGLGHCSSIEWVIIELNFKVLSGQEGLANLWMILPDPVLFALGMVWAVAMKRAQPDQSEALLSAWGRRPRASPEPAARLIA